LAEGKRVRRFRFRGLPAKSNLRKAADGKKVYNNGQEGQNARKQRVTSWGWITGRASYGQEGGVRKIFRPNLKNSSRGHVGKKG